MSEEQPEQKPKRHRFIANFEGTAVRIVLPDTIPPTEIKVKIPRQNAGRTTVEVIGPKAMARVLNIKKLPEKPASTIDVQPKRSQNRRRSYRRPRKKSG